MTHADQARNNAISLEAKKDSLIQRQSNDWKVSFTVQGVDMDTRLTQAPMGTRYAMVLVEIGDDETPVKRKEAMPNVPREAILDARLQPDTDKHSAGAKWREMKPQTQAGILINNASFATFLRENHSDEWHETGDADACIKLMFNIQSKTELETSPKARMLWKQLDDQYQAWKTVEHA